MQKLVVGGIPRGVGAPPPPGMDPRRGHGKLMCIKVKMLDDSVAVFHLGHKANGQALFDEVCRHLNLLECDYFGLEFIDGFGNRCWLEKDKSILRQITAAQSDARFYFICKFYTPNPTELEEDYTRYLLGLQIRKDLAHGELLCNENTAALLASFIVQAECGDFASDDYPDHTYLAATNFVPNQTPAFQQKIMDNHKKLVGMGPGEADLALLEAARRCDFYGIKLHAAKDIEGTEVALSVAHMGIKVFHQLNCISTFSWAKIRKLSFKRKRLMIKLHPESYQYYKETIEFNFDNRNECKNFWKKCVEHHAFFRCLEAPSFDFGAASSTGAPISASISAALAGVPPPKKDTRRLFSHGSSFRYQGRTQKQLIDYVREHRKRREPFQRPLRSNHITNDPYDMLRGAMASRKIQFNVIDPMLTSTTSATSGGRIIGQSTSTGEKSTSRCCPSQHQQLPNGPQGGNSADMQQRYPDVYYMSGVRTQPQQQYYNYHHCGHQQYNKPVSSHSNYYHQSYDIKAQQQLQYSHQQQQPPVNYSTIHDRTSQRPKSVYATISAAGDPTTHAQYNVGSVMPSATLKNHRSSNDVAGINHANDRIASRPIQQTQRAGMRREDSLPEAEQRIDSRGQAAKYTDNAYDPSSVDVEMSTSLPNVLAEDLKVMCQQYRNVTAERAGDDNFFVQPPPKSMSGESFLDDLHQRPYNRQNRGYCNSQQQRDAFSDFIADNMSEGSYRMSGGVDGAGCGNSSSTSDVGIESLSARALSTTFTTKRVGNVIVKRVIDSSVSIKPKGPKSSEDFDEDESYSESHCKMSSVSAPTSSRYHMDQRPIRQRVPLASTATDVYESPPRQIESGRYSSGNEEIYLKNYIIEQGPSSRNDNSTARGILKNVTNAQPSTSAEPRPAIPRPILLDNDNDDKIYDTTSILKQSRPVLVPPLSVRNPASFAATNSIGGSTSSSKFSTPQPTVKNVGGSHEHQISIAMPSAPGTPSNGKPIIVQGAKFTRLSDNKSLKTDEKESGENESSEVQKGIPGRVISKQNMVITPGGILPKEEIIGVQRGEKPKVPPKPKGIGKENVVSLADVTPSGPAETIVSKDVLPSTSTLTLTETSLPSTSAASSDSNNNANIESINKTSSASIGQQDKKLYEQIHVTVQSEDEPDVRRLQTFGADTKIPYTLTMRSVGTPKSADKTINSIPMFGKGRRQQTLDLIERKQLPAQNSFSSQDHSISPTSPESGNFTEYIRRRRSMSSDRCAPSDINNQPTATTATARKERRRQTQQVEAPIKFQQNNETATSDAAPKGVAPKACLDEDLPEPPPPSVLLAGRTGEKALDEAAQRLAQTIVSGILETDF